MPRPSHHEVMALHTAAEQFYRAMLETARELGAEAPGTWHDRRILRIILDCGPLTIPELMARLSISRQRCSTAVARLTSLGLVERRVSLANFQSSAVHLTAEGREWAEWSERTGKIVTGYLGDRISGRAVRQATRTLALCSHVLESNAGGWGVRGG